MTHDLKPYPAYKDSGVPWLGEVPEHWNVRRLKYLLRERDARSADGTEQLLRVSQYTGVTRRVRVDGRNEPDTRAESLVGYKRVEPDELVVNIMLAWNGSLGVSRFDGIASPAYCVYRFKMSAQPWYFHHLLRSPSYKARIKALSTGVVDSRLRLYTDDLYGLEALLPSLSEQSAILRFLNHVDRRTRSYMLAKQKLIKLLGEQKHVVIQQLVTRGLNHGVRLKTLGLQLGVEVPQHWNVLPVRRLVSTVTSGSRGWATFYSDEGDVFLQSGNLGRSLSLNLAKVQYVQLPSNAEGVRTKVKRNDILICITGALTGNVIIVDTDLANAYVNQHVALVRPRQDAVEPKFLAYCLHSRIGQAQFKASEYGGTKQGLGLDEVKSALVPLPPRDEQALIVSALDEQLKTLNVSIERIHHEMDLVREYRTRLIADVVTGKVDVRDAVADLPDEMEEPEELPLADELEGADDHELTSEELAEEEVIA